ncbi:N-acylethanolamine-hydrolyzing acid amidase-like [Styela clava]
MYTALSAIVFVVLLAGRGLKCSQLANSGDFVRPREYDSKGDIPPTYIVNLDLPPRDRWTDLINHFDRNQVLKVVEEALKAVEKNPYIRDLAVKIAADLDRFLPPPYSDEIRGISEGFQIDLGLVVFANIFYDMEAYAGSPLRMCTSIVTMDREGQIIHGRNFDFDFADILRNITVVMEFQKGAKTLFYGVGFAGMIGPQTVYKPGAFTLSVNQRNTGKWWLNLLSALREAWPTVFYIREVSERSNNYAEALAMTKSMRTISPNYFICGGMNPYEGFVGIGNRWGAKIETFNNAYQHKWYLLETNYDPWTKPPASDDRRNVAIKLMNSIGQQNMDVDKLYNVLSTPPILNDGTTFTTLMSARNASVYHTVIRHP